VVAWGAEFSFGSEPIVQIIAVRLASLDVEFVSPSLNFVG